MEYKNTYAQNILDVGYKQTNKQTNSVALARKRTTPTEKPPLVGEVIAKFCG
jgi:hypothetical protein